MATRTYLNMKIAAANRPGLISLQFVATEPDDIALNLEVTEDEARTFELGKRYELSFVQLPDPVDQGEA
ncbi:MAG: hypothetical protein NVV60_01400 [Luteimonas sp.]|nr:hypothetical protein [Luteimonas sp.]